MRVFVAPRRRLGRFQMGEVLETAAAEHAGQGGEGDVREDGADLGVSATGPAQFQDVRFQVGGGFARPTPRSRRAILQAKREALLPGPLEPTADSLFADAEGGGRSPEGGAVGEVVSDQFGSHERGERGISVHRVRGEFGAAGNRPTTSLTAPDTADNLLKHDS